MKRGKAAFCLSMLIVLLLNSTNVAFTFNETSVVQSNQNFEKMEKLDVNGSLAAGGETNLNMNQWKNLIQFGNKTRLIVRFNSENGLNPKDLEKISDKYNAKIVNTVSFGGNPDALIFELPSSYTCLFIEEMNANGMASYIEPSMLLKAQLVPNDPYWPWQWGPQKIMADWAWNITIGSTEILVAVVDTGIYYWHEDLSNNYVALGYDWVNNDPDPLDDHGHGTHCAGIIAAVLNNNVGISGLAQVKIMAEKVLDYSGSGYADWVANGIIHATNCGAKIISLSLGGYGYSQILYEAVKYAYDHGVLLVAAAGNDNTNMKLYPAAFEEVIAVAATDQNDYKASFSNWGEWIELSAPGVNILSTVPLGYGFASGTSMATPHVAGVAALTWSRHPGKSRDWVRLWLKQTADDLGLPGFDLYYGYGRINARKAVEQTPPTHELIAQNLETPPYVKPETTAIINATVLNFGLSDETNVQLNLIVNGTITSSITLDYLTSGNKATVSFAWSPTLEGLYNLTLYIVPVEGETNIENNRISKHIYVGRPVKAVVLQSAGNIVGQIITNWQVLTNEWHLFGSTMVYIDYTTLNKDNITYEDIASTEADVLIISCAYDPAMGWQFTDKEIEAIKKYVQEGHGLIATAGTFYYQVPNNNKLAPLFGLNEYTVWYATGTDLLHLINVTHPMFAKVPNPLVFPQVGTAIPSDGVWDSNELTDGVYLAIGHYRESAIVSRRGLVYISPWLEIIPPHYHHHLQLLYNAILWSKFQKPQHELVVSLEAPEILKPNQTVLLNATVYNHGLNDEADVEFKLLINGEEAITEIIPLLRVGESYTLQYLWGPAVGLYNVSAYAPPLPQEEFKQNNAESVEVAVGNCASIFITEDNWPIPPDNDLDYYMFNIDPKHPIEWMHNYAGSPQILKATLQIMAWDVDLPYEVDEVYFNGHYIGQLTGYPDVWAISKFNIPASYIKLGPNIVEVYVDRQFVGWYGTTVDWANLTVVYVPYEHDLAVAIEAPKFTRRGSSIYLNVTAYNLGLNDEVNVEVQLYINSTLVSENIPKIEAGGLVKLSFLWIPIYEGCYNITVYIPPKPGEEFILNNLDAKTVYSIPPLKVAVLGDFNSQLTSLLKNYAVIAEERNWDVVGDISTYNVIIVNKPSDPGKAVFLAFLDAADKNRVGLIFTSSWPSSSQPYGISLLQWYLGDPQGQGHTYGFGPVYYQVLASHSILEGWDVGERVYIITGGDRDFSWFWGYSGVTIANIGADGIGIQGAGIAYKIKESGNKHVLLAGLAPQVWTNTAHWTEDAKILLLKSVIWAGKPYFRNIAVTDVELSTDRAVVGESIDIMVEAENQGDYFTETFQVNVYATPSTEILRFSQQKTNVINVVINPSVNIMWIEPPMLVFNPSSTPVGYRFNVTVHVSLNVPSYCWQMYLTYNKNHLRATGCWYSAGAKSQWAGTNPTIPSEPFYGTHNTTHDYVLFGECLLGQAESPPGIYSLAIVEFEIVRAPPPGQAFESQIRLDVSGLFETFVLDVDLDKIPLTFAGATYIYGWVVPPPPPPPQLPPETINIGTFMVSNLSPKGKFSRILTWDTSGVSAGNYTVWVEAQVLPGEFSVEDNRFVDGWVLLVAPPKASFTYSPTYPMPGEAVLFDASSSTPDGGEIQVYVWDFGDGETLVASSPIVTHRFLYSGEYNVSLTVIDSEGLSGLCWKIVYVCLRDISIVNVSVARDWAYVGQRVSVNVTVLNKGEKSENFEVWLYYDVEAGGLLEKVSLSLNPGECVVLTFVWNTDGFQPCRSYVLTAYVPPLFGERNVDDNMVDSLTVVKLRMVGDVNGDGKVDMKDVAVVSMAFGSAPGLPKWNFEADLNGDFKVDIRDVAIVSKKFGSVCS